jgi:pimeloyl-ACP methyl ester carboxylesterase
MRECFMILQKMMIHNRRVTYRTAGSGPVVLLIHGMAGSCTTWKHVMPELSKQFTVIAPDLLGHGQSAKEPDDYSLGSYASLMRDLLVALGHERATVVGQSLGGGIAMQLAYQYPERCQRLVLVGSGGLGREVNPLLRLLTMPGAETLLRGASATPVLWALYHIGSLFGRAGMKPGPEVDELLRSYYSLSDLPTRQAFFRTLRSVIDKKGQAVSAENRLYLAAEMPTLIVWGDSDPIIPVSHAHNAHSRIRGSRLEIFEGVGHYPHCAAPSQFVGVLSDFIETTIAAQISVSREHVTRNTPS